MSTTNQQGLVQKTKKTLIKYAPIVVLVLFVAVSLAYRHYSETAEEDTTKIITTQATVSTDANNIFIKAGFIVRTQIDLAHLHVPSDFAFNARNYMKEHIGDNEVEIEMVDDSSGIVTVATGNLNYALVRYGLAQAEGDEYVRAESKARKEHLGIWSQ